MSDTDNTSATATATEQPATPLAAATPPNPADAGGAPTDGQPAATSTETQEPGQPRRERPWYQTRIDQLTAARRAAETRAQQLEAQLNQQRGGVAQPATQQPTTGQPAFQPQPTTGQAPVANPAYSYSDQDAITQRAQQLVAEQQFNNRCNEVANLGKTSYPDFQQTMENFNMLGGLGQHMGLLQAATAMDNAHEILYSLGKDLNQAMRISALPPVQQGIEMARLSAQLKQRSGAQVSGAPAPINPISGTSASPVPAPDANGEFKNQDEFRRFREAQRAAKRAKR